MNSMRMLQKNLRQRLTRGAKVVIGESYPEPELRGQEMVLASKSVVKCNGKGRCAHDGCIGLAAFVTEPGKLKLDKSNKKGDKSENIGWRAGTAKICLTHLRTPEGEELVPEQDEPAEPTIVSQGQSSGGSNGTGQHEPVNRMRDHMDAGQNGVVDTSWPALARASQAGNLEEVTRIARALKAETERLRERLLDTQDRLLSRT